MTRLNIRSGMATKGIDKTGNNWIRVIGDTGEMLIYIDGK